MRPTRTYVSKPGVCKPADRVSPEGQKAGLARFKLTAEHVSTRDNVYVVAKSEADAVALASLPGELVSTVRLPD